MSGRQSAPTVLVVDDDPRFRSAVERWLERRDVRTISASTASDAVERLAGEPVDLVLLDLGLPDHSGHEVMREMIRQERTTPVIIISGTGSIDDVIQALRHRAVDYLRKPFDGLALDKALAQALGRGQPVAPGAPVTVAEPGSAPTPEATDDRRPPSFDATIRELASRVVRDRIELPALDPRVSRVQGITSDPFLGVSEVVRFIGDDPGIVASVLHAANCALFNPGPPISTLREACVRLGNRRVANLATEALVHSSFEAGEEPYTSVLAGLWRNTTATARIVDGLARTVVRTRPAPLRGASLPHRDDLYLAALLHNLGELLAVHLLSRMPAHERGEVTLSRLGAALRQIHEPFGNRLATRWQLPPLVRRLAGRHHRPDRTPEPTGDAVVRHMVLAAWTLALRAGYTYLPEHDAADPTPYLERFQLREEDLADVVGDAIAATGDPEPATPED